MLVVLSVIENGYKIQFLSTPQQNLPIISNPSLEKSVAISNEINKHLLSGAISKVKSDESQFVHRVFIRKKSNGENRMIIDLKEMNKQINKVHFRMEDKEFIKDLISPGDFMGSIDLKDALWVLENTKQDC